MVKNRMLENIYIIKVPKGKDIRIDRPCLSIKNIITFLYKFVNVQYKEDREKKYTEAFGDETGNQCMKKSILLSSDIADVFLSIIKDIKNTENLHYDYYFTNTELKSLSSFLTMRNISEEDIEVILKDEKCIEIDMTEVMSDLYEDDIEGLYQIDGINRILELNKFLDKFRYNSDIESTCINRIIVEEEGFNGRKKTSEVNVSRGYFNLHDLFEKTKLKTYKFLKSSHNTLYLVIPRVYVIYKTKPKPSSLCLTEDLEYINITDREIIYKEFSIDSLKQMFKYIDVNIINVILKKYKCRNIDELLKQEISKLELANTGIHNILICSLNRFKFTFEDKLYSSSGYRPSISYKGDCNGKGDI